MEPGKPPADAGNKAILSALHQPVWEVLANSTNVLIAGCGGGYDFFSGIPIYFALKKAGMNVWLGNLTFAQGMGSMTGEKFGPACLEINANSVRTNCKGTYDINREDYWPELKVARWFKEHEKADVPVYMFDHVVGVEPLRQSYQAVIDKFQIDTVILCDGGTDSLMRGDESGLGTPTEDMASIAAVNKLKVRTKILMCIGLGIDTFHGVSHSHFLENVAALSKIDGAFLGTFSLLRTMEEAHLFKKIYLASQPENSIVCSSLLSAVEGQFGNHHSEHTKPRTKGSQLYISPLMNMYWCFTLAPVAERVIYINALEGTKTRDEVRNAIHKACAKYYDKHGKYTGPRKPETIPY